MTILLVDATNICITLLQTREAKNKLAIGDWAYPAEICLDNIYKFCFNHITNGLEEVVMCFDKGRSWRKDVAGGGYKANRDKRKAKLSEQEKYASKLRYYFLDGFIKTLGECNVFNVVSVNNAEADDGIAVLTKHLHLQHFIDIYSGDVDMATLTKFPNTRHWRKGWVKYPYYYKTEDVTWKDQATQMMYEIIRGQPKDGVEAVVNIPGADNNFRFGKVAALKVMDSIEDGSFDECGALKSFREMYGEHWKEVFYINMMRNKKLLDFEFIPEYIENQIITEFENKPGKPNFQKLFQKYNLFGLEEHLFAFN